jgi:hypothetical protein
LERVFPVLSLFDILRYLSIFFDISDIFWAQSFRTWLALGRFYSPSRASMRVDVFQTRTVHSSRIPFSFQGDPASSEVLACFLRPVSSYGGSVSFSTSGADCSLSRVIPLLRTFPFHDPKDASGVFRVQAQASWGYLPLRSPVLDSLF